jgi:hypothetical protein
MGGNIVRACRVDYLPNNAYERLANGKRGRIAVESAVAAARGE